MKLDFLKPQRKKIVIYDNFHIKIIKSFFKNSTNQIDILFSRGEKLNLYVLLMVFLKFKPLKYLSYFEEYLKCVKPKLLITMTDNDRNFYKINLPNCKKIFIQNGRRTRLESYEKKNSAYNVDKMFVHSNLSGLQYKKIIKGETCSIGSVYSNLKKISKKKKIKKQLLYVSTFRMDYLKNNKKIYKNIQWKDYIFNEIRFLKALNEFLIINNFNLVILAKYGDQTFNYEKDFFLKHLNKKKFKLIKNSPLRNSFSYLDKANLIIGNDSTLCYEAFGRGNKVFFFGIRGKNKFLKSRNFLYPIKTSAKSIFWDNTNNFINIDKSIKTLINLSESNWKKYFYHYRRRVMDYDYNNSKIKNYINGLKIS